MKGENISDFGWSDAEIDSCIREPLDFMRTLRIYTQSNPLPPIAGDT